MKAIFSKRLLSVTFSALIFGIASSAQAALRINLVWTLVQAGIRNTAKDFAGLKSVVVRELRMSELEKFTDQELGAMFSSIYHAAETANGYRPITSLEDFVRVINGDQEMRAVFDSLDQNAARAGTIDKLSPVELGTLVNDLAKARKDKIDVGATDIIPCYDCGLTETMRRYGITVYLKRGTKNQLSAIRNAPKETREVLAAIKQLLGSLPDFRRLSPSAEAAVAKLDPFELKQLHAVINDAAGKGLGGAQAKENALAYLRMIRTADGGIDPASDNKLFILVNDMRDSKGLKQLLDQANKNHPNPGLEAEMQFCKLFRAKSQPSITSGGQKLPGNLAAMQSIDEMGCWGDFFARCK